MEQKTQVLTELMHLKSGVPKDFDDLYFQMTRKISSHEETAQNIKTTLIIYASGSIGANNSLNIPRGQLKKHLIRNFYFCDYPETINKNPSLDFILSPKFQNGVRIMYKIHEIDKIQSSIKLDIALLVQIAQIIEQNYNKYDSFLILFGMDAICYFASALSFMLENLDKLVVCTGGYLPLSKMRNQSCMNLNQSFAVISQASSLNEVLIVSKNKGYRGNRCIKRSEGDFQSIDSPNLQSILSIKTKLRIRSYLLEPKPSKKFTVFYDLCPSIKFLQINFYQQFESLEYQLNNPFIKGMVIESYSFANLPNDEKMLNLFKKAHQQRGIIFINISQSIKSNNQSLMADYLKNFHIHYGADMTPHAALSKLSYLLGKNLPKDQIIKKIGKSLRGELTQAKNNIKFQATHTPLMKIVSQVIHQQYPTNIQGSIISKIQQNLLMYQSESISIEEFKDTFGVQILQPCEENQEFQQKTCRQIKQKKAQQTKIHKLIHDHKYLHLLAKKRNKKMFKQMLNFTQQINALDKDRCSPMFYALQNQDKQLLHSIKSNNGRVIAPIFKLFDLFVKHIKADNTEFFQLLIHTEFKQTLKDIENLQKRKVSHIAALLGSYKCYKYIKQKLRVSCDTPDIYKKTATDYIKSAQIAVPQIQGDNKSEQNN